MKQYTVRQLQAILLFIFTGFLSCCTNGGKEGKIRITIEPLEAKQGENVTLMISGEGINFFESKPDLRVVEGETGISLGQVSIDNPLRARARLEISEEALPDEPHIILVAWKGHEFRFNFRVLKAVKTPVVWFDPPGREQGFEGFVTLKGQNTHFLAGETHLLFPDESGIKVLEIRVNSSQNASIKMSIPSDSSPRLHTVSVSTNEETANTTFEIYPLIFPILTVNPDSIRQGYSEVINLFVENMEILEDDFKVEFPQNLGISVEDKLFIDSSTVRIQVKVSEDAPLGWTPIILSSGGKKATGNVKVIPMVSSSPFIRIFPSVFTRGSRNNEMQILGFGTHFAQGETTVSFDPPEGIQAGEVTVLSSSQQRAITAVDVDDDAAAGARYVIVATGDEIARGAVTITDAVFPSVNADPFLLLRGSVNQVINFESRGISFLDGFSDVSFPRNSGIVEKSEPVIDPLGNSLSIVVDVMDDAPTGPVLVSVKIGSRDFDVPMLVDSGGIIPILTIMPPYVSVPSMSTVLNIRGNGTHFDSQNTMVFFEEPSIDVLNYSVINEEEATVEIKVPSWVTSRRCILYVVSGEEIISAWFSLSKKPVKEVFFSPVTGVPLEPGKAGQIIFVEGQATNFLSGYSRAELHYKGDSMIDGVTEGLRIDGINIINNYLAQLMVSAYSTSLEGTYPILIVTGAEIGMGTVELKRQGNEPGIVVEPEVIVAGETSPVEIYGTNTNFDAGKSIVRLATSSTPDLTIPGSSVLVRDRGRMSATFISTSSSAGITIPIIVQTDVEIAGTGFSIRESGTSPYLVSKTWSVRKGVAGNVLIESRGGIDFVRFPPEIRVEGEEWNAEIQDIVFDETHLNFRLDIDSDSNENLIWLNISNQEGNYNWRVALYVFEKPAGVKIENSSLFESGERNVSAAFDIEGISLPEAVIPSMDSVDGKAFIENLSRTGDFTLEGIIDFSVLFRDELSGFYVTSPEVFDGALYVPFEISRSEVTNLESGSIVMRDISNGESQFYDFSVRSSFPLLISFYPEDSHSEISLEVIGKSQPFMGIEPVIDRSLNDIVFLPSEYWQYGYIVSVKNHSDEIESYLLSLNELWSNGVLIEELEPNDSPSLAQGLIHGHVIKGQIDTGDDEDYFEISGGYEGICVEALSTNMAPNRAGYPAVRLVSYDSSGIPVNNTTGNIYSGKNPVLCYTAQEESFHISVESEVSMTGHYLLFLRPVALVNEIKIGDTAGNFIELECASTGNCDGWNLRIIDVTTGSTVYQENISNFLDDGFFVIGQDSSVENVDEILPLLGSIRSPIAIQVCDPEMVLCDSVQIGGEPGYGEGEPLNATENTWRRLWNLDTNNNSIDFHKNPTPSPGR